MQHLTLETLARLVDEAPDHLERAHLDTCRACGDELEAMRRQTEALSTLPAILPPPDAWPTLRSRLRRDGVIRDRLRPRATAPLRAAAAALLFLAGGATGYLVRGPDTAPIAHTTTPVTAPVTAEATPEAEVARTEEEFFAALDRYMRTSGTESPDPAARLAVLDNIVLTTAEALRQSPTDPVINSLHLTAVAQQRELRRRLAAATREPVF